MKIKPIKGKLVCDPMKLNRTINIVLANDEEAYEDDKAIIVDMHEDDKDSGFNIGDRIVYTRMLGYQTRVDKKLVLVIDIENVKGILEGEPEEESPILVPKKK